MEYVLLSIKVSFVIFLYFIPALAASRKNRKNAMPIFVLNLLLGWTFIGWVIALVWAAKDDALVVAEQAVTSETNEHDPTQICPHCAETVKAAAKVCKHCHGALTPRITVSTTPVSAA